MTAKRGRPKGIDPERTKVRRQIMLAAALRLASCPGGWYTLTRQKIAKASLCSEALVSRYLGNMPEVRKAIMREAIRREILEIISQSIAAHDGYAVKKCLKHKLLGK